MKAQSLKLSYNDLVPDVLQNELIRLGDASSMVSWRVGDIVLEVLRYNGINHPEVGREMVYSAVAAFCGKQARTVREYAFVCSHFPQAVRGANSSQWANLAFNHYRAALLLAPDDPGAVLDWAVGWSDRLGRPATVDMLVAHFIPPVPGDPYDRSPDAPSPVDQLAQSPVLMEAQIRTTAQALDECGVSPTQLVAPLVFLLQAMERYLHLGGDEQGEEAFAVLRELVGRRRTV